MSGFQRRQGYYGTSFSDEPAGSYAQNTMLAQNQLGNAALQEQLRAQQSSSLEAADANETTFGYSSGMVRDREGWGPCAPKDPPSYYTPEVENNKPPPPPPPKKKDDPVPPPPPPPPPQEKEEKKKPEPDLNDVEIDDAPPHVRAPEGQDPPTKGGYYLSRPFEAPKPPKKFDRKYATIELSVAGEFKGEFKPNDANTVLKSGWKDGLQFELAHKMYKAKESDATIKSFEIKGLIGENVKKGVIAGLAGEAKITWGSNATSSFKITIVEAKKEANGDYSVTKPKIEIKPYQLGLEAVNFPINAPPLVGKLIGSANVGVKVGIKPNWAEIAKRIAGEVIEKEGASIVLEGIALSEFAAIMAPIAFAGLSLWAILDLDSASGDMHNIGSRYRAAMETFKTALRAGLKDEKLESKNDIAQKAHVAGKNRRKLAYTRFREAAQPWIDAQKEAGRPEADWEKELQETFNQKFDEMIEELIAKATPAYDLSLRRKLLTDFFDNHSRYHMHCLVVFLWFYPGSKERPWLAPEDLYNRARAIVGTKAYGLPLPWSPRPTSDKDEQADKDDTPKTPGHKDLQLWCISYLLRHPTVTTVDELETAYLQDYPDATWDGFSRSIAQRVLDFRKSDPITWDLYARDFEKKQEPEEEDFKPTAKQLQLLKKDVGMAWSHAKHYRSQSMRKPSFQKGEKMYKEGLEYRKLFLGKEDYDDGLRALVSFDSASETWGFPRAG